ncbi:MAG: hypothetical protein ACLU9S_09150 [Oscillospiraceae bacterium]
MQLSEEVADQIAPMLAIYRRMLGYHPGQKLVAPPVNLMEILAAQLLLPAEKTAFEQAQRAGAVASSRRLALRGGRTPPMPSGCAASASCCSASSKSSTASTRNGWSCWNARRCCMNWGTGPTSKTRRRRPMMLIKSSYIYGLDDEETMLVAEIARYGNPHRTPDADRPLPEKQRLLVDKLAAIMGLADAGYHPEGADKRPEGAPEEDKLAVTAAARDDLLLEKWAFQEGGAFLRTRSASGRY